MLHIDINTGRFSATCTYPSAWMKGKSNKPVVSHISHSLTIQLHHSSVQPEVAERSYCRQQAKPRHTNCKACSAVRSELGRNVMPQQVLGKLWVSVMPWHRLRLPTKAILQQRRACQGTAPWSHGGQHKYKDNICHALPWDKQILRSELCFKIHSFTTKHKPIPESGAGP